MVSDASQEVDLTIGVVLVDTEDVTEATLVTGAEVSLETAAEAETVRIVSGVAAWASIPILTTIWRSFPFPSKATWHIKTVWDIFL